MPANWTIRLPQTTHRFVNTPETGNVAASCNETIKKNRELDHILIIKIITYLLKTINALQSTMGLYRRSLRPNQ
jgi:hypothetical protein